MGKSVHQGESYRAVKGSAAIIAFAALMMVATSRLTAEPVPNTLIARADTGKSSPRATIIDLQPFKSITSLPIRGEGKNVGRAELINLNPTVNVWYLLKISWPNSKDVDTYHLVNKSPKEHRLALDAQFVNGIVVTGQSGNYLCDLWSPAFGYAIKVARFSKETYSDLCDGKVYLRNEADGNRTTKEWVVDILRDNVWGGEQITSFVKETFYKDKFLLSSDLESAPKSKSKKQATRTHGTPPLDALVNPNFADSLLAPKELGIAVDAEADRKMAVGHWYEAKDRDGVYVSLIEPKLIKEDLLTSDLAHVNRLDTIESGALVYLIGFDLSQLTLGFGMGTDHPRVGWSERVNSKMRTNAPGPDGIDNVSPIVSTGMIHPETSRHVISTFTGGFKRSHGAFKWGKLAEINHGSHYGFVENGVIFSKLQPGLATVVVDTEGEVTMKTWREEDDANLASVRYARQNGVPLIDFNPSTGKSAPGEFVKHWGPGNWSGSQDQNLRTLRAGLCLQENGTQKHLIYAYFSSVTPSAMARVFQAYNCTYAMHLDMNALEHTYLALFAQNASSKTPIQHLVTGMSVLDKVVNGKPVPRFIGFSDNRDYFYVKRR